MEHVPLPEAEAWRGVGRCVLTSLWMLARRQVHTPRHHVGRTIEFADGTRSRVYRETTVPRTARAPCFLVVTFRLRAVRGGGHRLFRVVSLLNTPLFVGFPGFVSKLWMADDERGRYRGLYEWDGPALAEQYARSLWRVLELVSVPGSIHYQVVPGLHRDDAVTAPALLAAQHRDEPSTEHWWRVVA
jgi:hypothetical protein